MSHPKHIKMMRKLSREQINNIKINNVYAISLLGMKFETVMKIFLYGMGFLFALPGFIKHTILFFWTEQEYLMFYEQLPIEIGEGIQSPSILSGILITGFTYIFFIFFNLISINHTFSYEKGVIKSKKILKTIIYKGKRVKARVIDKDKNDNILIKGKSVNSVLYSFESVEFNNIAKYATLNFRLKLKEEQYVYWHPKYPELVIPSSLVDS